MPKIERALVSVTDKAGIVDFVKELAAQGVEIISTGGTAKVLSENGVKVVEISDYTGFPEMMDGRLKTLHPKVHGGLLGIRANADHMAALKEQGIQTIDMLVVNLYRFEETVAKGCELHEAIENIDIGGPTMLRAAAKNYQDVSVVTDPEDYAKLIEEMQANGGSLSAETNFELCRKTFALTARYDAAISNHLMGIDVEEGQRFPKTYTVQYERKQVLRYGENPHQKAAFYGEYNISEPTIATAEQLWGKELSYNNIMDADAALDMIMEFDKTACVILKHSNPCGAAQSAALVDAYTRAFNVDATSAFGGIVGFNRSVDAATAEEIAKVFTEVIIAPDYDEAALEILKQKKNVRLLRVPEILQGNAAKQQSLYSRRVAGGLLLQDRDLGEVRLEDAKVVTKRQPSADELEALKFAWRICKYVKSNAIVYATKDQLIGVGAGQMSRVDSSELAVIKAGNAGLETKGSVLASDAFFPFADGVEAAAKAGATAVVQPGGSVRDEEVIAAADANDMAMIMTGMRHFRH